MRGKQADSLDTVCSHRAVLCAVMGKWKLTRRAGGLGRGVGVAVNGQWTDCHGVLMSAATPTQQLGGLDGVKAVHVF